MSNHIYITRHGESQWNLEGKVQGVTDIPLTPKEIEQAHELARKIKENRTFEHTRATNGKSIPDFSARQKSSLPAILFLNSKVHI